MSSPQNREEVLFALMLEKPAAKRAAFLDAMCDGDDALRQRLEARLTAHEVPDEKTSAVAKTIKLNIPEAPDEAVGQTLGRYKLLEKVGEGGCGVVYVAEQSVPVRRRVALKVIKLGMDTKAVVARFEAERQALAMMDHPNIAKVLDAGTTETGRPYFIMELVRGIRITDYCDQANLTTEERIDLFIKICQAIQHAHQKGIIHRDIKPSNILVTLHDGVPVPKVIDFGIAKAIEGRLTDSTVYTQLHQFIGTPAYMSPEQAEMSGLDVDTRSDIYSLGVLLYELLAGSTPFDANELVASGIDAMRKIIREKEPVRPSTRFATLEGDALTTTAKRRSADTAKLMHQLKGDLDWIVMKCLEKDRSRRYETANGLAADLKRHLNNEPIVARPPSAAYKFQKAFRRNKVVFTACVVVAAALFFGIFFSTWQAVRAKRAEAMALQSRSDAEKLSNFMLDDFYTQLEPTGQYEAVAALAKRAVAYYDGLPASLRTSDTERNRAMALARLALVTSRQVDSQAALPMSKEVVATLEKFRQQGDQSDGTIYALGLALEAQGECYWNQSDVQSASGSLQQGADLLRPFATSAEGSARVKLQYANILNYLCHFQSKEQGVATSEEALHVLAGLGALDLSDLSAASAWADVADSEARVAMDIGRLDDAERLEKQVGTVAAGVLTKRPGDLRAKLDLFYSPDMLSRIEEKRFHDAEALELTIKSRQAAEEYLRFNPSDTTGWDAAISADLGIVTLLYRLGRISEGLQNARAAVEVDGDRNSGVLQPPAFLWGNIALQEAQRGNRGSADQALQEARGSIDAYTSVNRMSKTISDLWKERFNSVERYVRLASGEDETVYSMASQALPRLDKLQGRLTDSKTNSILIVQHQTLDQAARAALNLEHFADAESVGRALFDSPLALNDRPDTAAWGRVLLAQALAAQGRKDEALKILAPALAKYADLQTQGASYVEFRQHFARACYVQALAEPADNDGVTRSRAALDQATALLQGLTDEARQLHDSKELFVWIAAARKKLGPDGEVKQP
jgi:tRNA A-37 threonylcarbamoyl transferase component Bud32/tetratricopeptide (TPR) repeat protein